MRAERAVQLLAGFAGFAAGAAASYVLYSLAYGTFVGPNGLIAGLAIACVGWSLVALFWWRTARQLKSLFEYWRARAWDATRPDRPPEAPGR